MYMYSLVFPMHNLWPEQDFNPLRTTLLLSTGTAPLVISRSSQNSCRELAPLSRWLQSVWSISMLFEDNLSGLPSDDLGLSDNSIL